jgi:all-trans-retinol dehydrogenase (NAD+)
MSVILQRAVNLLALPVTHVALNPVITAALLWVLTKGPPQLRSQLTSRIAALRDPKRHEQILKGLKWCLALGVAKLYNKQLNHIAMNAGRLQADKARWEWSKEVAVITGGCSGIGELVAKRLLDRGIKVAVLDIQELPRSLLDRMILSLLSSTHD